MNARMNAFQRSRGLRFTGVAVLAVITACALSGPWVVSSADRGLARAALGYDYEGKPFTGIVFKRHRNGKFSKASFLWQGKFQLTEYHWYASGVKQAERNYQAGLEHGMQKNWHPDGSPMSVSRYENGLRQGESWSWWPDGTTAGYSLHERGDEVAIKRFSARAKPFHNYVRVEGKALGFKGDRKCDRKTLARR